MAYRRLAHAFDETMQRIITDTLYRSNIAELHGINDHVYIHNNTTRGRIRLCVAYTNTIRIRAHGTYYYSLLNKMNGSMEPLLRTMHVCGDDIY
jgi:hypothetical protein